MAENGNTPVLDPSGLLRQRETWNDVPGSPMVPSIKPDPGTTGYVQAFIDKEYVAGGYNNWYNNWARVLPFPIDDLTEDFGYDLYFRMMQDPQVASSINVYRAGVLQQGASFMPAVRDKTDPGYDKAQEILEACEAMWANLECDPSDMLWNLEEACAVGNKIGELLWLLDTTISGKSMWRLIDVAVKPQTVVSMAVNVHRKIIGLLGLIPGIGYPVQIGTILPDPSMVPNLLPRGKFIIRTFRPRDNDPRGTSLIRPAYTWWNLKMQLIEAYLQWLAQFATPMMFGFTGPQALPRPKMDSDGNPVTDGNGNPVMISPQQAMADRMANMKSSSVAVFPFESKVQPVEMRGQGAPFVNAFHLCNDEITQAIQHQALTTQTSGTGTRAQAGVHQNTQGTIIRQGKWSTARTVKNDILRKFVLYNYGEQYVPLTPDVSLGQMESYEFAANAAGVAALQASKYLDETQLPGIDEMLGMPQRGDDWQKRFKEAQMLANVRPGSGGAQPRTPAGTSNQAASTAA